MFLILQKLDYDQSVCFINVVVELNKMSMSLGIIRSNKSWLNEIFFFFLVKLIAIYKWKKEKETKI